MIACHEEQMNVRRQSEVTRRLGSGRDRKILNGQFGGSELGTTHAGEEFHPSASVNCIESQPTNVTWVVS